MAEGFDSLSRVHVSSNISDKPCLKDPHVGPNRHNAAVQLCLKLPKVGRPLHWHLKQREAGEKQYKPHCPHQANNLQRRSQA